MMKETTVLQNLNVQKNSRVCHFILKDQFLIHAFVLTVLEHLQQIFTQLVR